MNMTDGPGLRDVLFVNESLQKGEPFIVLTIIICAIGIVGIFRKCIYF